MIHCKLSSLQTDYSAWWGLCGTGAGPLLKTKTTLFIQPYPSTKVRPHFFKIKFYIYTIIVLAFLKFIKLKHNKWRFSLHFANVCLYHIPQWSVAILTLVKCYFWIWLKSKHSTWEEEKEVWQFWAAAETWLNNMVTSMLCSWPNSGGTEEGSVSGPRTLRHRTGEARNQTTNPMILNPQ